MDASALAAFLDARADGPTRDAVLAQAADSEDVLDVLANAAAAIREAEGSGGDGAATAGARRWTGRRSLWLASAAAALVLGVAIWRFESTRSASVHEPSLAALAGSLALATQASLSWSDEGWGTMRGSDEAVAERVKAARIGALLIDLHVASSTRDRSRSRLASELSRLLDSYPAGSVAAATVRSLDSARAGQSGVGESPFGRIVVAASGLASRDPFRVGAAVEATRLALLGRDTAFLRSGAAMAIVSEAATRDPVAAHVRNELSRLQGAARGDSLDWDGSASDLTGLLHELVQ